MTTLAPSSIDAVRGLLDTRQAAQQRGLAGAVAPDDHDVVAPPGVEGHPAQHLVTAVTDAELRHLDRDGARA